MKNVTKAKVVRVYNTLDTLDTVGRTQLEE